MQAEDLKNKRILDLEGHAKKGGQAFGYLPHAKFALASKVSAVKPPFYNPALRAVLGQFRSLSTDCPWRSQARQCR